tara:strand:- start:331 stop:930 length:600 start_codon:yes stop_codon:yes gene_type:complete
MKVFYDAQSATRAANQSNQQASTKSFADWAGFLAGVDHNFELKQQIEDAITIGSLHHVIGRPRWRRKYNAFEPWYESLAREVRVVKPAGWSDHWLWGRELWLTRRSDAGACRLIAWTEDKNGRIVRGWSRQNSANEASAYDTPGKRSCPGEGAWMPSVLPGQLTFPAFPFLLHMDGNPDPRVAETVRNLLALRPVRSFR